MNPVQSFSSGRVPSEESSSSSGKRARTSSVWDVFERLPVGEDGRRKAKCTRCGKCLISESTSGTSSLHRHLAKGCGNTEGESDTQYPVVDHSMFRVVMAKSILRHNYPFNIVEHEGTREVHKFLNPTVRTISRNTAKADVLACYDVEKEVLKKELELIPGRICLTSDLWSSSTTDSYMCMTAHYVDLNWVLQKKILIFRHIPSPHSGPILGDYLIRFLTEWGIDKKVFTITLDNAKYQDRMVETLKEHLLFTNSLVGNGDYLHVRCSAHVLNLIVQNGLKTIGPAVHKIRESVKYVKGSQARKLKFAECVRHVGLKVNRRVRQDVPTRWNSTYLMLESVLAYRMAFYHLQLVDNQYSQSKCFPTQAEWSRIEKITLILKPFYDITVLFSGGSYPTANLYFSNVRKIQQLIEKNLTSDDVVIQNMATFMSEKFKKYWDCYSIILSFAIILDPRYKLKHVDMVFRYFNSETAVENVKDVRNKLFLLFGEYMQITPRVSLPTSEVRLDVVDTSVDDMDLVRENIEH